MPTYEFRCRNGHEFERFYRKISDAPSELTCPDCSAPAERQLSAGAGLLFKGSGFYLTDYGKNAHRKPGPSAAGKGEGKGAESGGDSKGESSKGSDAKSADAKSGESKGGESKSTAAESKPTGTKSSGSSDKS